MEREIGRRNLLKLTGTVVVGATLPANVRGTVRADPAGAHRMGSILPLSGGLETFGRGMEEAVNLAVSHVNAAGGPLGRSIDMINADSGSDPRTATSEYERLVSEEGILGFVGAGSSTASRALARQVADDRVMQVSPSSTGVSLAEAGYGEAGNVKYFGRTAWNDAQQGPVMGLTMETHLDADTAAFLYIDNVYGEGLVGEARASFDGETLRTVPYSPDTSDYTSTLDRLLRGGPDAVGFIGYPDSGRSVLRTWADEGYGGRWVLSEALSSADFLRSIPDVVEGMYTVSPAPEPTVGTDRFREELGHEPTLFSANAYDALFLVALAVHRAGEGSGTAIAENIRAVSRSPGTDVTVNEFHRATELLDGETGINYQGASGPVELNENLEPITRFEIRRIRDGTPETVEEVPRSFFTEAAPTTTAPSTPPSTTVPDTPTSPPPTEPRPATATTTDTSTPVPTETTSTPPPDGTLSPVQLWASGLVGLVIGFLTGNSESDEITKSALTLLAVLFGGGGLLRLIQSGRGPSTLLVIGTAAVLLGILVGIVLRHLGLSFDSSDGS